jgi:hypothetical protein
LEAVAIRHSHVSDQSRVHFSRQSPNCIVDARGGFDHPAIALEIRRKTGTHSGFVVDNQN